MTVRFDDYLAWLDALLRQRRWIVERVEAQLLNVRGKPLAHARDRRVFERAFDAAVYGAPGLPPDARAIGREPAARHGADGFEPVVIGRHVQDLDPLDLVIRAYEHWDATRWPGASARLAFAGTLYAAWMVKQIGLLGLRSWDDGDKDAGRRLDALQRRLDGLNAAAPDDAMAGDVRWLVQTTLGPFTRRLEPYLVVADRIERTLEPHDRLAIHDAGARLAGGHLRSQLRYRSEENGKPIDDPATVATTRHSNALDAALLVADLEPLLDAYRASLRGETSLDRLGLADAILQGLSADPDLFVLRWDLLMPVCAIEQAFIAFDDAEGPRFTAIGRGHVARLARYRVLLGGLAAELRADADALAPADGTYSPFGISYGFITDVLANMAMTRLTGVASRGLVLEDMFASTARLDEKLERAGDWQGLPRRAGEAEHFSHSSAWAARMYARVVDALDARVAQPTALNASATRSGRILLSTSEPGAGVLPPSAHMVPADEFCVTTSDAPATSERTRCSPAEFSADRAEGRLIGGAESGGEWFGVSKAVVTLVLAQGQDAQLTNVPAAAADVLAFAYADLVVRMPSPTAQPEAPAVSAPG